MIDNDDDETFHEFLGETKDSLRKMLEQQTRSEPAWLIDGMMPAEGISLLVGAPGSGKTNFAIGAALAVAARRPWLGHTTKPQADGGRVLLVLLEGVLDDCARRIRQIAAGMGITPSQLYDIVDICPRFENASLQDTRRHTDALVRVAERTSRKRGYDLVVIDNLTKLRFDEDENNATAMATALKPAIAIAENCAVLLLHHANARGDTRGSTAIKQTADMELRLDKPEVSKHAVITLTRVKERSGAEDLKIKYRINGGGPDGSPMLFELAKDKPRPDKRRYAILDALAAGPLGMEAIHAKMYAVFGKNRGESIKARDALERDGLIEKTKAGWALVAGVVPEDHAPDAPPQTVISTEPGN